MKFRRYNISDLVAHAKTGDVGQVTSKTRTNSGTTYTVSGQRKVFEATGSDLILLRKELPAPELEEFLNLPLSSPILGSK